jgi:hypothetical protein
VTVAREWFVEILRCSEPETVEKRLGPFGSWERAAKVDNGANINLNHDDYRTRIVDQRGSETP